MEHRRAERSQLRGHGISHKLTACAPIWYPEARTLISIGRTLTELDRLDNLRQVITACYALALRSTAQYAIEAEPGQAEEFRRHLEALQEKLPAADSPEAVQAVQASFRGELRDYRDKVQEKIGILRKEMEAAAAAMQEFADGVTTSGADHEEQVKEQLTRLEAAAACDDLGEIRSGIHAAAARIAASFDRMRRANQLVIAQLRDEIRLLHQQISRVWNRQRMETRIAELFLQNQPFCLLLISVRNLKGLDSRHSRAVIEGALKGLMQRFDGLLGEGAVIGRWSEDEFAAILEVAPAAALAFSREAARELSGNYAVQENGLSQNVELEATAGVIDRESARDYADFHRKLAQLGSAISGS